MGDTPQRAQYTYVFTERGNHVVRCGKRCVYKGKDRESCIEFIRSMIRRANLSAPVANALLLDKDATFFLDR